MPPPTVADAVARLEEAIPLSKAAAWDAVGLQVGDPGGAAGAVAVCHEVTGEVVEAASAQSVELLVAYHPLLFRPAGSFVAGGSAAGRAFRLAAAGTALYVVHTAFDVADGGCADALAEALCLEDIAGFGVGWPEETAKLVTFAPADSVAALTAAMAAAGGGRIGDYTECAFTVEGIGRYRPGSGADPLIGTSGELSAEPEVRIEMVVSSGLVEAVVAALVAAHPYDEPAYDVFTGHGNAGFVGRVGRSTRAGSLAAFRDLVADELTTYARFAGEPGQPIDRVAVVPGSGSDLAAAAAAAGADVLVTGDVSHHRARQALSGGMAVVDAGHAATERPGVRRLYSLVSEMFESTIDLTHLDPTPWETA